MQTQTNTAGTGLHAQRCMKRAESSACSSSAASASAGFRSLVNGVSVLFYDPTVPCGGTGTSYSAHLALPGAAFSSPPSSAACMHLRLGLERVCNAACSLPPWGSACSTTLLARAVGSRVCLSALVFLSVCLSLLSACPPVCMLRSVSLVPLSVRVSVRRSGCLLMCLSVGVLLPVSLLVCCCVCLLQACWSTCLGFPCCASCRRCFSTTGWRVPAWCAAWVSTRTSFRTAAFGGRAFASWWLMSQSSSPLSRNPSQPSPSALAFCPATACSSCFSDPTARRPSPLGRPLCKPEALIIAVLTIVVVTAIAIVLLMCALLFKLFALPFRTPFAEKRNFLHNFSVPLNLHAREVTMCIFLGVGMQFHVYAQLSSSSVVVSHQRCSAPLSLLQQQQQQRHNGIKSSMHGDSAVPVQQRGRLQHESSVEKQLFATCRCSLRWKWLRPLHSR